MAFPILREFFVKALRLGSETGPRVLSGTGSPESAVTAPVGSLYAREDGGANSTLYRKESGAGNTGWVAVSNAAGGGANDLTVTYAEPSQGRFFDVALSGATVGQKVLSAPSLTMPAGVAEDELEMDPLVCHGAVKTINQVRLFVGSANGGILRGARNISVTLI